MSEFTDIKKVMARLKKLLALATSPNQNEAAAAMRQAQKLMAAHEISAEDVELSRINEESAAQASRANPPQYMLQLASLVEDAFGVRVCLTGRSGAVLFTFVGFDHRPLVASYAFDVLRRQLAIARADYLKTLNKRLKKTTKSTRADLFCRAWIFRIRETVIAFAQPEIEKNLLDSYWEARFPAVRTYTGRSRQPKARDLSAANAGYRAADGVTLNHGVNGSAPAARLTSSGGRDALEAAGSDL